MAIWYGLNAQDARIFVYFKAFYLLNEVLNGVLSGYARRILYLLAALDVVPTSSTDHYSLFFEQCSSREQWSVECLASCSMSGLMREGA